MAWKHDNVFIDTSAYLPRYHPPQLALDRAVKQTQKLRLSDEARMELLARAARRVFKL